MDTTYIAMDWALATFAIAWQAGNAPIEVFESTDGLKAVKNFLVNIPDKKIMTLEEGTYSQWLYTEIKPFVDELIVCNTRRNSLLLEGAKNDRIDALKLLQLLKADLLKPVYHSFDHNIQLRKLVSGYNDFTQFGVRLKNQKSAILRSVGLKKGEKLNETFYTEEIVLKRVQEQIDLIQRHQSEIKNEFDKVRRRNESIRLLESIPGIGEINSVRILAAVVDPHRFENKDKFLSYAGLVKHERSSAGKVYSHRSTSFNRGLKLAFRTATLVCIQDGKENYFNKYYNWKLSKGLPAHDARNATARKIAVIALGVMKSKKKFNENKLKPFTD